MLRFLILFSLCFACGRGQAAGDVIGCGGFIKSETDINYKVVRVRPSPLYHAPTRRARAAQVQLITKDGIPIYTTEAAPING